MEYASATQSTGQLIKKRWESMYASAGNWRSHWNECAKYVIPRKDDIYGGNVDGEKKGQTLYDTYAIHACENTAAALHGMLTNATMVWFGFTTGDKELDADDAVQKYLQQLRMLINNTMNASNFQTEVHEYYIDLLGFGTGVLNVEEDEDDIVRFRSAPIYDFSVQENHKGVIDVVYYKYQLTLHQIVSKFGMALIKDNQSLKSKYKENPEQKMNIIHAVEPVSQHIAYHKALSAFKFASFHILEENCAILHSGGYHSNPFIVGRWTKLSGEQYGRGPAMKALADIKMVNEMKKATIEAAQLTISPPILVPDDGVMLPFKMKPRSVNFYRAGSKDEIKPLNTGVKVDVGEMLIEQTHKIIDKAFFTDMLRLVENDRMTAAEVMQRRDEQLRTLSPISGRQHHEFLKPVIERVYDIHFRRNLLPTPPKVLLKRKIQVQYTSQIVKAQMSAEGEQVSKAFQLVLPFLQVDPGIMDNFDLDKLARFTANIYGMPHDILRDVTEVKAVRQGRAEAQQEQAQQQAALNQSQVAMNMGKAGQSGQGQ